MTTDVLLNITTPIRSICLLDKQTMDETARNRAAAAELEQTRKTLAQVCAALEKAAAELEAYRATLFSSHREQIVRLSLEIAAKILAKEVSEGNYAIEKIVMDALQSAPPAKQTTLRLNPEDAKAFEKAAAEQNLSLPAHLEVAADWAVKPAECIIDSELGMVESIIKDHLEHISEALLGTGEHV